MRKFLVAYMEYEQQMHVATEDGGDRVLARRRELVASETPMIVPDKFLRWPALNRSLPARDEERD